MMHAVDRDLPHSNAGARGRARANTSYNRSAVERVPPRAEPEGGTLWRYLITVESTQPPAKQVRQLRTLTEAVGLRILDVQPVGPEKAMPAAAQTDSRTAATGKGGSSCRASTK